MSQQLEQVLALNHGEKPEYENVDKPQRMLALFQLVGKNFALYGTQIKEVLAERPIPWIPCYAPVLEGVINYRERVESVMRLDSLIDRLTVDSADKRTILVGYAEKI